MPWSVRIWKIEEQQTMLPQVHFETRKAVAFDRLAIFGATGDVTARLFLPALANLVEIGRFPSDLKILAIGRREWNSDRFRQHLHNRLMKHSEDVRSESYDTLLSRTEYRRIQDLSDPKQVKKALGSAKRPFISYLAIPPSAFHPLLQTFDRLEFHSESRIIFEKPFGENLKSSKELNQLVHRAFSEHHVFRIDHFLGKQTVKNILGFRFANRFFEPIWNHQHIERVEIMWDETLALEGRASYYDSAGALKDMIQNHLLQLLCLIGMEPPTTFAERDFRDRKVEVLRSVRRLSADEVKQHTVRARYDSGQIKGRKVPAYVNEEGVDPDRQTETFAQITLRIDNWRWAGVPFTLRSGKGLVHDRQEIAVYFRPVPHLAFGVASGPTPNVLRFRLNPESIEMSVNLNGPGDPFQLEPHELMAELTPQAIPPYGNLFIDVLEGDPTMFIRADEVEELWRIVEPILETWEAGIVPLESYPAGSNGP